MAPQQVLAGAGVSQSPALAGRLGIEKRDIVLELVRDLPQEAAIVPVQALGELFNVLTRKAGRSRADVREAILGWRDTFPVVETAPRPC